MAEFVTVTSGDEDHTDPATFATLSSDDEDDTACATVTLGDYPDPASLDLSLVSASPIDEIQPELRVCTKGRPNESIKYDNRGPNPVARELVNYIEPLIEQNVIASQKQIKIIFIVHGFRSDINTPWMEAMRKTILRRENKRGVVVIVGWGRGSNLHFWQYSKAAANIKPVGKWLGEVVNRLTSGIHSKRCITINPLIWGVGHSLGAHLLGIAGRNSNGSFDRISGLDPAGPLFKEEYKDIRLDKKDAKFVDVIHTDGFEKWPNVHYGTLLPLGTIDFYPNWGGEQPGVSYGSGMHGEDHHRAIAYFQWSIKHPTKFITNQVLTETPTYTNIKKETRRIGAKAQMGYFANYRKHDGLFYLKTNAEAPWE